MRNGPFVFAQLPRTLMGSLLVLLLSTFVQGQGRGGVAPGRGQQNLEGREWALTHVGDEANSHFNKANNKLPPRLREDFQQLQIVNNNLMKTVFVQQQIETAKILVAVTEIKKRAVRLRVELDLDNLAAETCKDSQDEAAAPPLPDQSTLPKVLLRLDQAVMGFVNNPLFQNPKVIDSKLVVKANDDLTAVQRTAEFIANFVSHPAKEKIN